MRTSAAPGGHGPNVVIIGGGASGTLTAVHLLAAATARRTPLRVTMIDRYGRHGQGQAYATTHPAHLLNAPARQMSAVAGDPDHFSRWASTKVAGGTDGAAFLPREAYGRYLRSTLADAQRQAEPLARLQLVTSEVQAIQRTTAGRPLRITLWLDRRRRRGAGHRESARHAAVPRSIGEFPGHRRPVGSGCARPRR
jgi:uncharacterized NAD(P)/FAD-binding protein YdhS